jgi:hypothetical protein
METTNKKVLAKRWHVDEADSVDLNWFSVLKLNLTLKRNPVSVHVNRKARQ